MEKVAETILSAIKYPDINIHINPNHQAFTSDIMVRKSCVVKLKCRKRNWNGPNSPNVYYIELPMPMLQKLEERDYQTSFCKNFED